MENMVGELGNVVRIGVQKDVSYHLLSVPYQWLLIFCIERHAAVFGLTNS
jgi:hypothetical protein